jgi:hypothetical protein
MNGKGDTPRPLSVNRKTFENNWDLIFKKETQEKICEYSGLPNMESYNAPERNETHPGEYPRVDEDGNRIEQEPC